MSEAERLKTRIAACFDRGYEAGTLQALAESVEELLGRAEPEALARMEEALGYSIATLAPNLRLAADAGVRHEAARQLAASSGGCACSGDDPPEPGIIEEEEAVELLGKRAVAPIRFLSDTGLL